MEKILQEMRMSNQMFGKELKIVYWVIGISGTLITIALTILAFKK